MLGVPACILKHQLLFLLAVLLLYYATSIHAIRSHVTQEDEGENYKYTVYTEYEYIMAFFSL